MTDSPGGWTIGVMIAAAIAIFVLLRRRAGLRFIAASVPFWIFANSATWIMQVAVWSTIAGLAVAAVGPTLPGRRKRGGGSALPELANGPLAPVTPRMFQGAKRNRLLTIATAIFALFALALGAAATVRPSAAVLGGLAIGSAIIAITFAFSNWFASRMRLRVDGVGLHSRVMFGEHTISWTDVAGLTLRYVFLPGLSIRIVYFVVFSANREFAFLASIPGSSELKTTIESATGLTFQTPEFESTF